MRVLILFCLLSMQGMAADLRQEMLRVFSWTDYESTGPEAALLLSVYLDDEQKVFVELVNIKEQQEYPLKSMIKADSLLAWSEDSKIKLHLKGKGLQEQGGFQGFMVENGIRRNCAFSYRSRSAGESNNRYFRLYGNDTEIEAFAAKIQSSLKEDNRVWISAALQYPMYVEISPGNTILLQTRQQFMDQFIKIFDSAFREKILSASALNMKSDEQGVELGKGCIRINNTKKSNEKKYQFVITSIKK